MPRRAADAWRGHDVLRLGRCRIVQRRQMDRARRLAMCRRALAGVARVSDDGCMTTIPAAPPATAHTGVVVTADSPRGAAELFALDESTCAGLLHTHQIGRLVTAGEDPRIVPVNYVAVDGAIVFHVAAGPHADRLVGQRAAFEVDVFDETTRSGWSVVAHGRISTRLLGEPGESWPRVHSWVPGDRDCRLTLVIETMTGRLVRGPVVATASPDAAYL